MKTGKYVFRKIWRVLLIILVLVIMTAGILVLVDFTQRRRISRQYAALSEGGSKLEVDGAILHFRQSSPTSVNGSPNPAEPPLVLIHGLMGSSMDFALIQPKLTEERTVIAVDLIGFGLSDKSTSLDFSKRAMAEKVAALMEKLGYDHYDVLGHSMGGEVAMNMAVAYPDRVSRLILLDSAGTVQTGPGMSGNPAPAGQSSFVSPLLIDLVFKNTLVENWVFRTCLFDPKPFMPEAFEKLYYFVGQIPPRTLARFIADSDSGSVANHLGEIRQPTRIIWGEQDRIIPSSQGYTLQAAIPGSQLQVIPQSGHLPYLEKPADLIALIEDFLK